MRTTERQRLQETDPEAYRAYLDAKAERNRGYRARKLLALMEAQRKAAKQVEEIRTLKAKPLGVAGEAVEFREEWLASAVQMLYPVFASRGYSMPEKVRASLARTFEANPKTWRR
jgi:hypothetical protein